MACKGTGRLQGWGGESSVVGLRAVSGAEKLHSNLPYLTVESTNIASI